MKWILLFGVLAWLALSLVLGVIIGKYLKVNREVDEMLTAQIHKHRKGRHERE